ncbi:MAG: CpsD/CapB family tyrosine-protein kinase [Pseudomonadota bacterium]
MDRISKALELAKKPRRGGDSRWSGEISQDISYTHTRTIHLDQDHLRDNLIIGGLEDKRVIDTYKLLRTRLLHRMQQNNWKTLGISSSRENEGKTLTSINLAISIAMKINYTVILVDADLRRPSIHKCLGMDAEYGLSDYLESDIPIEDIMIHPGINRLIVIPGSESVSGASELLASPKMINLVKELKSRYPTRLVLFDLPPVLVGDDVVAFAPYIDAAMLVVEDGRSRSDELGLAIQLLEETELIGTVLNKSTENPGGRVDSYYY